MPPFDYDLLVSLTEAAGVPGYEDRVRELVRDELEPHVDSVRTDAMGNLLGTIEGNHNGITSHMASVNGVNVTVRDNGNGIFGMDSGNYDLEDSRVVDNEGYGIQFELSSSLTLNDSTVSGHGIYFPAMGHVGDRVPREHHRLEQRRGRYPRGE
jgi:hypothetical protein